MNPNQSFKLIDGTFTPDEGKEILRNLFAGKIQFHLMKNFSTQVRFGKADVVTTGRVQQLSQSLNDILNLIAEAEANGKQLSIQSQVVITTTDSPQQS